MFRLISSYSNNASNKGKSDLSSWNTRSQEVIIRNELGITTANVDRLYELIAKDSNGVEIIGINAKPSARVREQLLGLAFGYHPNLSSLQTYRDQLYQNLTIAEHVGSGTLEFFPLSLFKTNSVKPTVLSASIVDEGRLESCDLSSVKYAYLQAPYAIIEACLASNSAFSYCNFAYANVTNTEFYNCDFLSTIFGHKSTVPGIADNVGLLMNVGFKDSDFDDVDFADIAMINVKFSRCELDECTFNGRSLPFFHKTMITRSKLHWQAENSSGNNLSIFHTCEITVDRFGRNIECLFERCKFTGNADGDIHFRNDLRGTQFRYCEFNGALKFRQAIAGDTPPTSPVDLRGVSFEGSFFTDNNDKPTKADFVAQRDAGNIMIDETSYYFDGSQILS